CCREISTGNIVDVHVVKGLRAVPTQRHALTTFHLPNELGSHIIRWTAIHTEVSEERRVKGSVAAHRHADEIFTSKLARRIETVRTDRRGFCELAGNGQVVDKVRGSENQFPHLEIEARLKHVERAPDIDAEIFLWRGNRPAGEPGLMEDNLRAFQG